MKHFDGKHCGRSFFMLLLNDFLKVFEKIFMVAMIQRMN